VNPIIARHLEEHFALANAMSEAAADVFPLAEDIWARLAAGGCLYAFGNGGSAAEAQHFVGELIGRFKSDRRPLAAVTLGADTSALTCIANDFDYADVFARQVSALAGAGDIAFGFTTSGSSPNVLAGLHAARRNGALTVMFTGLRGAEAAAKQDHAFVSPSRSTARIQEMHQLAMHMVCDLIEDWSTQEQSDV